MHCDPSLTAGRQHPDGQGSTPPGFGPHSATSAAIGELWLVPSPLWVPGPRGPGIHWTVGMQSAWRGAGGTVSRALLSLGGLALEHRMQLPGARARLGGYSDSGPDIS